MIERVNIKNKKFDNGKFRAMLGMVRDGQLLRLEGEVINGYSISGGMGATGPQGVTGLQGATGVQGRTGIQGVTGVIGDVGAVFILDVTPASTGSVSQKLYEDDIVLTSCGSDTRNISVSVVAFTGPSRLKPIIYVNGSSVATLVLDSNKRWEGTASVSLPGSDPSYDIVSTHGDGAIYTATMTMLAGPVFSDLHFVGGYPGIQTECKLNDSFSVNYTVDSSISFVEISNYQAAQLKTISVSGVTGTVSITVANRGSGTYADQTTKVRALGINGIWGDYYYASSFGAGDGSAYIQLNNDTPSMTTPVITYPAGQQAIKSTESAVVSCTIGNTITVAYTSPTGEITIDTSASYSPSKTVTFASGTYNISTNNYLITAIKVSNQAVSTKNAVVYIADADQSVAITEAYTRLRSSPAGTNYTVTFTSTQRLLETPTIDALPEAVWAADFVGSNTLWYRVMTVDDADVKGSYAFTNLSTKNLAGKTVVGIGSGTTYTLGGFTLRTLTIAAWPNREADIGTYVSSTAKLVSTNLSKGVGYTITFEAAVTDTIDKYTITEPTTYSATGRYWRNNDIANAVSNVSGSAQLTIEEIV